MKEYETTTFIRHLGVISACAALAMLYSAGSNAQDYSKYPTVMNPAKYGTIWAPFYAKANELTQQARTALPHHLDIPYGSDPKQRVDVYLPPKPDAPKAGKKAPVLLFFHGGGFKEGDRAHYGFVAMPYAKHGIITVVSGYRLAVDGVHYPAPADDARSAVLWVHRHIAQYGGDPDRIYLSGHSVGATLSGEVGFDRGWLTKAGISPGIIKGIAAVSGAYEIPPGSNPDYAPTPQIEARASPLHFINDPAPTIVVACGDMEQGMKASSQTLYDRLQAKGIQTKFVLLNGADHKDTVLAFGTEGSALSEAVLQMIERPDGSKD